MEILPGERFPAVEGSRASLANKFPIKTYAPGRVNLSE
jgi:hypothetical protein